MTAESTPPPLTAAYHWKPDPDGNYETLFRPDGTEVATITEPEDRISYRDLAPITAELNAQASELTALRKNIDQVNTLKEEAWARETALREALAKYGVHGLECTRYGWAGQFISECKCGLARALSGKHQ